MCESSVFYIAHRRPMNNIFGEPLQPCRRDSTDRRGSWDDAGKCSELGGGVHQICATLVPDFSSKTGQSDWSAQRIRGKKEAPPHCLCLGAYALYTAKIEEGGTGENLRVHCESIPDHALTADYVDKWSTWNGNELPDQIVHGVGELVRTCLSQRRPDGDPPTATQRQHLTKHACTMLGELQDRVPTRTRDKLEALRDEFGCKGGGNTQTPIPIPSCLERGDLSQCYNEVFVKRYPHARGNRNAAGFLWTSFLLDHAPSLKLDDLRKLSKQFCAISGSIVHPKRGAYLYGVSDEREEDDSQRLRHASPADATHGVHHCCRPCVCDLQEGARVVADYPVQTLDGSHTLPMLVLRHNPCKGRKEGDLVSIVGPNAPAARCTAGERLQGARYIGEFPIIGFAFPRDNLDMDRAEKPSVENTEEYCTMKAQGGHRIGMGNIFRDLAGLPR